MSISHTARNRMHARHHLDAEMESARPTDDRSLVNDDTTSTCTTAENMQSDLYMAAKRGNTDFIKKKMEDMERSLAIQRSPKLNTILHIAASSGHDQLVEAILESHTNLQQCQNLAGDLPLHVAVRVGHLPMVKKLAISSEEFISSTDLLMEQNDERNTPLHLALIKKYKEVDRRNLVLKSRYREIANFLVETEPEEEESPLYMAAEAGDAELVKLMIEKGVGSPGFPVPAGKSIVHAAITGKNIGN
ncbi:protein ACCELERATED CELL DEATH 6-like [Fagus crenata]